MAGIAMSAALSAKEVFEGDGLKPNHLSQRRHERFCTDKATSKIG